MIHWQPGVTLDDVEKQVILAALKFYGNNKTKTAGSLGIAIRTLDYKLEKYNGELQAKRGVHMESPEELPKK